MTYCPEEVLSEQVPNDHGASMFNGKQVNDHFEEDGHTDNVVEDDGTNTLIHHSFNIRMDDDDDNDNENSDDFDNENDIPLLNKAYEPLYEGSKTNIFFVVLLIMNLKVMNGFSNTSITQILRYVLCIIIDIYTIMINVIFVSLIFLLLVNKDEIFVINSLDIFILMVFF